MSACGGRVAGTRAAPPGFGEYRRAHRPRSALADCLSRYPVYRYASRRFDSMHRSDRAIGSDRAVAGARRETPGTGVGRRHPAWRSRTEFWRPAFRGELAAHPRPVPPPRCRPIDHRRPSNRTRWRAAGWPPGFAGRRTRGRRRSAATRCRPGSSLRRSPLRCSSLRCSPLRCSPPRRSPHPGMRSPTHRPAGRSTPIVFYRPSFLPRPPLLPRQQGASNYFVRTVNLMPMLRYEGSRNMPVAKAFS